MSVIQNISNKMMMKSYSWKAKYQTRFSRVSALETIEFLTTISDVLELNPQFLHFADYNLDAAHISLTSVVIRGFSS